MMSPCSKCGSMCWKYDKQEELIIARCLNCGSKVSFRAKTKEKRKMKEGDNCRKCGTAVILRKNSDKEILKKQKKNLPYYFTASFRCPKCNTLYLSEEFKVYNEILKV